MPKRKKNKQFTCLTDACTKLNYSHGFRLNLFSKPERTGIDKSEAEHFGTWNRFYTKSITHAAPSHYMK